MTSPVLALLVAAVALAALLVLAPRVGWVDRPDGRRKVHARAVPPVGGLAWYAGFVAGAAGFAGEPGVTLLLACVGAMVLLGAIDDRMPLPSGVRLLLQTGCAGVLAWQGGVLLHDLGQLLGVATTLGWMALPFTVFAMVGVVNALNMADGMDGLSGGYVTVTLLALLWLDPSPVAQGLTVAALVALLPFLVLNTRLPGQPQARVFLGDCGAMAIGLLLAALLVQGTQGPERAFAPVTALYLFALPLIDTVSLMWRRLAAGNSPFRPDQQHLHHLLQRIGLTVPMAWAVLVMTSVALAGLGVGMEGSAVPEWLRALIFLALALALHRALVRGLARGRLFGRALTPLRRGA